MDITVQELKERFDQNDKPILIDVRETWENEEFNIGGQLIPLGELTNAIPNLADHKDDEIVIYCRSGNRSGIAKQLLIREGFTNVRNLLGGMLDWQSHFGNHS